MLATMGRATEVGAKVAPWAFALVVGVLGGGLVLLIAAKGASNYLEDFCVENGRGPRVVTAYESAHPAGLGHWRCNYGDTSATYTAWFPYVAGAVSLMFVLLVFVAPLAIAFLATRRSGRPTQMA